jgi:hypothetical protein
MEFSLVRVCARACVRKQAAHDTVPCLLEARILDPAGTAVAR